MRSPTLKRGLIISIVMAFVILVGCSQRLFFEDKTVVIEEIEVKEFPIELYVSQEINLGKYEPVHGIYTGAYVDKDVHIQGDLLAYEKLMGQEQTFKVFNYVAEEGITKQEILKCIAQKKTPYIKIILGKDCDLTPLYQLIFDLKLSYHTPVFIELYPLTEKDYSVSRYKETYQRAYEILHKYLSEIVVVWSCDDTRVSDMALYYPGNGYVDWVGLNVYMPRYKQGVHYQYDGLKQLDYWYKSFQEKKPMLISALAISHYSRVDHAYTIQETQDKLSLFYDEILRDYLRIRGVIYMDVDMAKVSSKGKEDYSLTGETKLQDTMRALSLPLKILPSLEESPSKTECYMKYHVQGALIEGQLYIPQEYMGICFNEVPLRKIKHVEDLSGEIYYAYNDIRQYCTTYYKA